MSASLDTLLPPAPTGQVWNVTLGQRRMIVLGATIEAVLSLYDTTVTPRRLVGSVTVDIGGFLTQGEAAAQIAAAGHYLLASSAAGPSGGSYLDLTPLVGDWTGGKA